MQAYKVLRNPENREEYDILYKENTPTEHVESPVFADVSVEEKNALTDAEAHEKILLTLYKKRREDVQNPGVLAFYIKQSLHCSEELFEFHAWYLKAKGFIERTEQNELAFTVDGIDHVISASRTSMAAQLTFWHRSRRNWTKGQIPLSFHDALWDRFRTKKRRRHYAPFVIVR